MKYVHLMRNLTSGCISSKKCPVQPLRFTYICVFLSLAMKKTMLQFAIFLAATTAVGQTELLNNSKIIEMTQAGLAPEIITLKIRSSAVDFDTSSDALIVLKKAGVKDDVISAMLEKGRSARSPKRPPPSDLPAEVPPTAARDALLNARTIAFQKSSLNPSRQALEKELLKRPDWRALNLTIEQYRDTADLYVDIGFVPLSLITHRYVFRIYDRRTGAVIAGGETTSWGSLAKNLAGNISKSLTAVKRGS